MQNLTGIITSEEYYCPSTPTEPKTKIIFSAINIPLSITAFVGNVLVIAVLPKVSSLHPPSKLLLGCLASTNLCASLVAQPLYIILLLSSEYSKPCYYSGVLFNSTSTIFCAVSLMTLTAISVDRLLALTLGLQYRQVVTLRRVWVIVVCVWLYSTKNAVISIYHLPIGYSIFAIEVILCIIVSTCCYTKIYQVLRQNQVHLQDNVHQGQQNGEQIALSVARYRKTVSTALWVQITLVASYLPFALVAAAVFFYGPLPNLAWYPPLALVMLNSTLSPFLYCWKIREMKQAVKDTITQMCCFCN
ncbi:adenosine receptor A3-like [Montipora capricornis]|uniref:adenosine receptor A3-like n=1 Tax=Montipora capricornis TaxID=246305 RepID=UPI0035F17BA7